ncbi:MAG: ABC transporter substrate-binding protein [Chloroflexi bacterium]|nr:ABC transporter substrate-binding protein [Chloroflexota bacterium]MCI0577486.1 ABC transporter substrate-binding protein [Chloroflexota bacterium]MCI0647677.1 ABC transporter substrate-binding protein [Chloroflexota bacterium]MCI0730107.1 ABC transporter substrate-binding protein [Chloroflexota bacterium]
MILLLSCLGLGACAAPTPAPTTAATASPHIASLTTAVNFFNESPLLAARVAAGDLPPVDQRLPANPMILQPEESVGIYGGTLETPVANLGNRLNVIGYEPLVRWDSQWLRVIPNIAQAVDSSQDATTYTFHLRQGLRWSDGRPFTADDILFWYEAVFTNPELTPMTPGWLSVNGAPVTVETTGSDVVTFRFARPNSLFLSELATSLGTILVRYPRHYLAQFHPSYNPGAAQLVAGAGFASWVELFQSRAGLENLELPTLNAWVIVERGRQIVAERNPYYWKVDTDFNQLPYIDRVVFVQVQSQEEYQALLQDGAAHLVFDNEFTGLSVTETAASLKPVTLVSSYSSAVVIALNLNHPDPLLRQAFQNKAFRIGLSHAINRPGLIADFFDGAGEPYQVAPRPESPFYNEQLARQYTEYDSELANSFLDQAGYAQRDAQGFRLRPDGPRLSFRLETNAARLVPMLEFISQGWREVGVETTVAYYPPDQPQAYADTLFANQHDTYVSEGVGGLDVILQPVYYFPLHPFASWYATGWARWYLNPANPQAVEPPPAVQRQMELFDQVRSTADSDLQLQLMAELLEIAADEFYVMGAVLAPNSRLYTSTNLHNVPPLMPLSVINYPTPAPSNPAQYFITPTAAP